MGIDDDLRELREAMKTKSKVLICGTGPSIDLLSDSRLVESLSADHHIYCVHTSYHHFRQIDALFMTYNGDFSAHTKMKHLRGRQIRFLVTEENRRHLPIRFIQVSVDRSLDCMRISTDLHSKLPCGPTSILQYSIPTAMYCELKHVALIGAEYPLKIPYARSASDALYRRPREKYGIENEMAIAHKKWAMWQQYFDEHGVSIVNLSPGCELDMPMRDIYEYANVEKPK
jgi:hypothetical protein